MIGSDTLGPAPNGPRLGTGHSVHAHGTAAPTWQKLLVTPNIYAFLDTEAPIFFI